MRFSIFYEHQLPRPWDDGAEARVVHEALEQVQLADKLGFSTVWEVEHHFFAYSLLHNPRDCRIPGVRSSRCQRRRVHERDGTW